MTHSFTRLVSVEEVRQAQSLNGLTSLSPDDFAHHAPDEHWILTEKGELSGRCSLWWRTVPAYTGHRLGLVGHYAARNAICGHRLLRTACDQLASQDCTMAVGPIDGSTWRRYRLVIERGTEPPFFLEPDNPNDWPDHFTEAGFAPIAYYRSALNTDLGTVDPRVKDVSARLARSGITFRSLSTDQLEGELRRVHALSLASFRSNLLYSAMPESEFIGDYLQIASVVRPELVILAEQGNRLIGFLFAVPNLCQEQRGEPVDTVVLKTAAVLREREFAGLGSLLATRCHQTAREMGFRRVIHALMHESNRSRVISEKYAYPIRRYALFARPLTP